MFLKAAQMETAEASFVCGYELGYRLFYVVSTFINLIVHERVMHLEYVQWRPYLHCINCFILSYTPPNYTHRAVSNNIPGCVSVRCDFEILSEPNWEERFSEFCLAFSDWFIWYLVRNPLSTLESLSEKYSVKGCQYSAK